jgi:pimeloyl-ACP methyl ester carboxylesterase
LRQAGVLTGMSDGLEQLHYLLELPFHSPAFLHDVRLAMDFARNPIYAVLHEPSWADGGVTRWSAQRMLPDDFREQPELLTGEHVFPWVFEDLAALAPLQEAAELLAEREWPRLYDEDVLAANQVPAAAIVYADDPYVPRVFSEETAKRVRGLRAWVTNEYEHNGLRTDGERILGRLIDMARGRA